MINGFYTFYASNSKTIMPDFALANVVTSATDQQIKDVLKNPIDLINTLDNPILEKYFDIRSYFNLPVNYKEKYIK